MNKAHLKLLLCLFSSIIPSCNKDASQAAQGDQLTDSARFVTGQKLISTFSPQIEISFSRDFVNAGNQSFILFGNSEVAQFYFVKTDSGKTVNSLFTVQFENFLPGSEEEYNYSIKDSVLINGVSFLHSPVYNETQKVLRDTVKSDVWYRFNYLNANGYSLPQEVIGHRFVRLIDNSKQKEILIIYNEDIRNTKATAAELERDNEKLASSLDSLFNAALDGFVIDAYAQ